jgi:hypothetical protein
MEILLSSAALLMVLLNIPDLQKNAAGERAVAGFKNCHKKLSQSHRQA